MNDPLRDLSSAIGLQTGYVDAWGHAQETEPDVLRASLSALGFSGDPAAELASFRLRDAERLIPSAVIIRGRGSATVTLRSGNEDREIVATLVPERGGETVSRHRIKDLAWVDAFLAEGAAYERRLLPLPDLPLGYHRLHLALGQRQTEALVIAPPKRAWNPWRSTAERQWGLSVQLYGLRSNRNWGMGDFTDLLELLDHAADRGTSAVGLNPLHALFPDEPERASPYSPSTRLYRNPLYLDVEAIPDFARSPEARRLVSSYEFQRELGRVRGTDQVAYASVAALKFRVLRMLFETFERSAAPARRRAFASYVESQGRALHRLGTFERLRELRSAEDLSQRDWRNWPPEYQDPDSPAVAAFADKEATAIRFCAYLQWQIEEQLAACLERAQALGMLIGIYADLAVGVDAGGAEAWWNQRSIVRGLTIGAPPDPLNTRGQGWGLPLFNPVTLAEEAFEPFIAVLRTAMRHAGAIRIDHVLGLMRLWCVPDGNEPKDGAYLAYPIKDLIAIVALESHRHRCAVIGEDLGTLPRGLAEILADAGILSYSVLYFEQRGAAFRNPASFKVDALAAIGTHDLPPLARWWRGDDLVLRASLGLLDDEELARAHACRLRDRADLAHWAGCADTPEYPPVVEILRTLATVASRLVMVQFEDMLPEARQVNLPGTTEEHPNWRNKLEADVQSLFADRLVSDALDAVSVERQLSDARSQTRDNRDATVLASPPRGTYRLQFNADFTFADAERLVPYLADLGISHVYASSIFRARPGSTHGYDITDHDLINPEIGTEADFDSLAAKLKSAGIGLIVDFIPNHMGIGKADNDWWLDVLEWGTASHYANYFDIDWRSSRRLMHGKILLPFLGDQYGAVLAAGALELRYDRSAGTFSVWHGEHRFPIRPYDYAKLLRSVAHPAAIALGDAFDALPPPGSRRNDQTRQRVAMLKQALGNLNDGVPDAGDRIVEAVARINADAPHQMEQSTLHRLIERQHYRLAYWRVAADEINYRRFFDINDLAGVRVERPDVFRAIHRGIVRLIAKDAIQGIRLDHIDGLADPLQYLRRLAALVRRYRPRGKSAQEAFYVVVEKILGNDERLRSDWPIAGTTGYEFISLVCGLFVDADARPAFDAAYREEDGGHAFDAVVHRCKLLVMETMLASELVRLSEHLERIAKADLATRDFSVRRLRRALAEIVAGMDVYRTYATTDRIAAEDRRRIEIATAHARHHWRGADRSILDFVERVLTGDISSERSPRTGDMAAFSARFQQYTGPVMAKAVEDTAFYRYNRLLALNEVGGDPTRFGVSVARFHEANAERALRWPAAMLATSTHDTKRGEDARIRIATLTEFAEEWTEAVARWDGLDLADEARERRPHGRDAYLIYQILVGSWPAELVGVAAASLPPDRLALFRARVEAYVTKAIREAKATTSWTDPNEGYEQAVIDFVARLLDPARPFLRDFLPFQAKVARVGALGSIAQLVLKLAVPGVPDIYRGSESWDLAMADPDNRRAVDYPELRRLLEADGDAVDWSADAWRSGGVKVAVCRRLLALRWAEPALFSRGSYRPLATEGEHGHRIVAFVRRFGDVILLVAAGRLMAPLATGGETRRPAVSWTSATICGSPAGSVWTDVLSGRTLRLDGRSDAAVLMEDRPVGVWICRRG